MIMESIAERIQAALDYANLKWSAASLKLGLSAQAASNWKKGKIGKETLKELAALTGVSAGWLLDGSGSMIELADNPENADA
ncbi:helix-turn-helix domain-containing protein, partial [Acinetobacter baumannii]